MHQKVYITDQEFTPGMGALLTAASAVGSDSLKELAHSLWYDMKGEL